MLRAGLQKQIDVVDDVLCLIFTDVVDGNNVGDDHVDQGAELLLFTLSDHVM